MPGTMQAFRLFSGIQLKFGEGGRQQNDAAHPRIVAWHGVVDEI